MTELFAHFSVLSPSCSEDGNKRPCKCGAITVNCLRTIIFVMPKVADVVVETLISAGVSRIYGISGDSLNGITDSIRNHIKDISWVHMRHEEAAAFAAGAEAHLTGKLAACAGSCGPGNLHLINGLYDCHRSRVPVIAIAAHIPIREIGSNYFQETHPELVFRECSRLL